VPTASGVPLQLLPKEINGVRIIGIDVPGFGVPTHAEAKDVLAGAMLQLRARRGRGRPGGGAARRRARAPDGHAAGRDVPGRPGGHRHAARAAWAWPRARWCPRASGASSTPRSTARRSPRIHPFYTASVREFEAAGRAVVGSAPVGHDGTEAWLQAIGQRLPTCRRRRSTPPRTASLPAIRGALARTPIKGRITVSGYEGSELLVARLLDRERRRAALRGHGLPAHALVATPDREWLEARGVRCSSAPRSSRTSPPMREFQPDLAIGTTPVVQAAKQAAHPGAVLHQPHLGAAADGPGRRRLAGAGDQRGASPTRRRFDDMTRLLRRSRRRRQRRRLGRHAAWPARSSATSTRAM
jgi:chlorophyllide a reductase subunit Y